MKQSFLRIFTGFLLVFFTACGTPSEDVTELEAPDIIMVDSFSDLDLSQDLLFVNDIALENNIVVFDITYSGGCEEHSFTLYANRQILSGSPPTIQGALEHQANGDDCETEINTRISFDLVPLIDFARNENPQIDRVNLQIFRTFSTVDFGVVEIEL